MRADRLLSLVLLLQAHGRLPAPVLARRLEVSVRTVLRDVEALSAAGVPVYTARGRKGGVQLLDGYRIGASHLTPGEATSLAVGQPGLVADLGLGDALDLAMEKIVGAGGRAVRAGVEYGRGRILVDAQQWMRSADPVPLLPSIHDGVSRGRRLLLDYVDSEDRPRRLAVDPLGLVAKAGIWYLVAAPRPHDGAAGGGSGASGDPLADDRGEDDAGADDRATGGCRLFRVARIRSCEVTHVPAAVPGDADLEKVWTALRSKTEGRRRELPVRLAVAPAALPMVRRLLAARLVEGAGGGRPELEASFAGTRHAVAELLRLGTLVEVLAPADLRVALREAARELVDLYASAPPG
jgi:predicted DNA-binding transcriptional regulator YafY